jgi:glucose-1-phosphate thymidylyltransferase
MRTIEERQNLKVGCPEEIAHAQGWIDTTALRDLARLYLKTEYGQYLMRIASEAHDPRP